MGILCSSFDEMISTLEQREIDLKAANVNLEQRSQERAARLVELKCSYLRVNELVSSTLDNLVDLIKRDAPSSELLEILRQTQNEQNHLEQQMN